MRTIDADSLHRTVKLELDEGRAQTVEAACQIVARYVLQIEVGARVIESPTRQAMLLTAVTAASRCFPGGVRVRLNADGPMSALWAEGQSLSESVKRSGGTIVESFEREHPTLVIGDVSGEDPCGTIVLYTTWQGWAGAVVQGPGMRLSESVEFPLAGVFAAALGVSEAFQHLRGFVPAGRRDVGLSLWDPQEDWRKEESWGDAYYYLPSRLWLLGLGHLGQAYAWALGLLPYEDPKAVELMLQDSQVVVEANQSTGMLCNRSSIGRKKTRVIAQRLEAIGFKTCITERRYDCSTRRSAAEPGLALAGVDDTEPRRLLEQAGFDLAIDAGLGAGSKSYLDILTHCFPSGLKAEAAWPVRSSSHLSSTIDQPAYRELQKQLETTTSLTEGEVRCGVIELAEVSVGAAFVGCVAATLVLSEALRSLAGGPRFEVISVSLRSPQSPEAVRNTHPGAPVNTGFVSPRRILI